MTPPSALSSRHLWRRVGQSFAGNAVKRLALAFMGRRVLVVDDDVLVLEVVSSMLEELGCETVRVRSGTDALGTIAQDQTIDTLIADIDMPGLDGSSLATRARSFRPELPIILITGGVPTNPSFPLLRKPFALPDLERVMAETTGLC
jgi:two-component system, cell cycle response regulator CpdR